MTEDVQARLLRHARTHPDAPFLAAPGRPAMRWGALARHIEQVRERFEDWGLVRGDIVSESVLVNGRVEGSIRARKVQLAKNAHVQGDITHQSLAVEMGAVFEGQCRYLQDPLKTDTVAPAARIGGSVAPPVSSFGAPADTTAEDESHSEPRMVGGVIVTGAAS